MTRSTKFLCVFYALLSVAALIATWSRNLEFFAVAPNADIIDFIRAAYANPAAASLANDLWFLSVAVVVWMIVEAQRVGIRLVWVYAVLSFFVAISAVLPIFLVAREIAIARLTRSLRSGSATGPG